MTESTPYSRNTGLWPMRRKFKASDLPLASATRAAIEGLAHTFKKKGGYDILRKQIWDDLMKTTFETEFTDSLLKAAEIELEKNDYELLKKSRSAAQALIHGAVERAGVYCDAELQIDALIDSHIAEIENGVRTIRKNDIGEELAAAEFERGSKTDEQYAAEAQLKRDAREKVRLEARMKELITMEEKRKEEEEKIKAESEKRRVEREARRKAEREREEKKERDIRDRELRDRERKERHRKHDNESCRKDSTEPSVDYKGKEQCGNKQELSVEEIDHIEQEALNVLLKPTSHQSRPHLDLEIDKTLAPPPRKSIPSSAIQPISRETSGRLDVKKHLKPTKMETDSKLPLSTEKFIKDEKRYKQDRKRSRSRSPDRKSRRSSRSQSRYKDCRDRELKRSRRQSKDRVRDDRRRHESRDKEEKYNDYLRRNSKDNDEKYQNNRKRSHRSNSIETVGIERGKTKMSPPINQESSIDKHKLSGFKQRDQNTTEYLTIKTNNLKKETAVISSNHNRPSSREPLTPQLKNEPRKSYFPRERIRERYHNNRSRTPEGRRRNRIERSTSPPNIDRYVPGAHNRSDRNRSSLRSPIRKKARSRSRGRDRISRNLRDDERSHRSYSESHDLQREISKDRHRTKVRSRSRSPGNRRERESKRERSKSRDKDRYREKNRDWDRDRDRDRNRDRDRDRDRDRERERDRDRDRDRERERDRDRDRERDHEKKRERSRSHDHDRDRDREKKPDKSRNRDRIREKDRNRNRSRSRGSRRDEK